MQFELIFFIFCYFYIIKNKKKFTYFIKYHYLQFTYIKIAFLIANQLVFFWYKRQNSQLKFILKKKIDKSLINLYFILYIHIFISILLGKTSKLKIMHKALKAQGKLKK